MARQPKRPAKRPAKAAGKARRRPARPDAETWYADAMKAREDAFGRAFGPTSPPGQVLKPQNEQWELRIPGFAFLRYPPRGNRKFWLNLTHGLSQPASYRDYRAGRADEIGVEFAIATAREESWPLAMLELVAQYAVTSGRPILPHQRLPAGDLMAEAPGGHLLALADPGYPTEFRPAGGPVRAVHLVGVTAAEAERARRLPGAAGSEILENVLRAAGVGCVTDRQRPSLTRRPDFEALWSEAASHLAPREHTGG
jgi:Suppressor of fused protein (SUFU)